MKTFIKLFLYTAAFLLNANLFAQLPDSLKNIFSYKKAEGMTYKTDSTYVTRGVSVEKITYTGSDGFVVSAYVTHKKEAKNCPVISFNHWGEGDKSEFLEESISFSAENNFICILNDGPWLCPNSPITSFKRQGYEMYRQYILNVRIGLDLIEQNFKIDQSKIFCVGHSFGCNACMVLSAVDSRIDFYVMMAGAYSNTRNVSNSKYPDFVEWRTSEPKQFAEWIKRMKPLDGELYLPYKTSPCLIQVATKDEYIPNEENEKFIELTPAPKEVKRYDALHKLNDEAKADRQKWIIQQLK